MKFSTTVFSSFMGGAILTSLLMKEPFGVTDQTIVAICAFIGALICGYISYRGEIRKEKNGQ